MATNNATNNDQLTTNGQLLIGSTSATPVVATLTAGTGISVTNGAGSISIAATGGSSALTFIASATASSSATITFAGKLSATYDNYLLLGENICMSAAGNDLLFQTGTGAGPTYITASYYWTTARFVGNSTPGNSNNANDSSTNLSAVETNATTNNRAAGFFLNLSGANSANNKTWISHWNASVSDSNAVAWGNLMNGTCLNQTVLTSLKLLTSSGTISTGTFKLYGYQN